MEGLLHKAWALYYSCGKEVVVKNKTFDVILFYYGNPIYR